MPEINVGLAGGAGFLMEHLGRSKARAMYFTGRRVPAAELYRLGAIEACVPRAGLMDAALELARDIAGEKPAGGAPDQAHAQHHRGNAGARRLSLRADRDGRTVAHRGRQGSATRLSSKSASRCSRGSNAAASLSLPSCAQVIELRLLLRLRLGRLLCRRLQFVDRWSAAWRRLPSVPRFRALAASSFWFAASSFALLSAVALRAAGAE